jgi:hypothetical protein
MRDAVAWVAPGGLLPGPALDDIVAASMVPQRGTKRERGASPCPGSNRTGIKAAAVPATVGGEPVSAERHWETGKARRRTTTREPGDLPSVRQREPIGRVNPVEDGPLLSWPRSR